MPLSERLRQSNPFGAPAPPCYANGRLVTAISATPMPAPGPITANYHARAQ
jgi:hypothetical protein